MEKNTKKNINLATVLSQVMDKPKEECAALLKNISEDIIVENKNELIFEKDKLKPIKVIREGSIYKANFRMRELQENFDSKTCFYLLDYMTSISYFTFTKQIRPNPLIYVKDELIKISDSSEAQQKLHIFLIKIGFLLNLSCAEIDKLLKIVTPEGGFHYRDYYDLIFVYILENRKHFIKNEDGNIVYSNFSDSLKKTTNLDLYRFALWTIFQHEPRLFIDQNADNLSNNPIYNNPTYPINKNKIKVDETVTKEMLDYFGSQLNENFDTFLTAIDNENFQKKYGYYNNTAFIMFILNMSSALDNSYYLLSDFIDPHFLGELNLGYSPTDSTIYYSSLSLPEDLKTFDHIEKQNIIFDYLYQTDDDDTLNINNFQKDFLKVINQVRKQTIRSLFSENHNYLQYYIESLKRIIGGENDTIKEGDHRLAFIKAQSKTEAFSKSHYIHIITDVAYKVLSLPGFFLNTIDQDLLDEVSIYPSDKLKNTRITLASIANAIKRRLDFLRIDQETYVYKFTELYAFTPYKELLKNKDLSLSNLDKINKDLKALVSILKLVSSKNKLLHALINWYQPTRKGDYNFLFNDKSSTLQPRISRLMLIFSYLIMYDVSAYDVGTIPDYFRTSYLLPENLEKVDIESIIEKVKIFVSTIEENENIEKDIDYINLALCFIGIIKMQIYLSKNRNDLAIYTKVLFEKIYNLIKSHVADENHYASLLEVLTDVIDEYLNSNNRNSESFCKDLQEAYDTYFENDDISDKSEILKNINIMLENCGMGILDELNPYDNMVLEQIINQKDIDINIIENTDTLSARYVLYLKQFTQ